ncbi:hypothetical protein SAMN06295998_1333 [Primorskyibacter flagellatus]|uniref:Uncharacterized protein n=1 Tax=Primorskyibacter flagellatus TaxID=1387277 RepID=A0A1W2EMP4_9RHOB|nr:hypothetical protein SAMN06295998_1333 [Primorskyibacter flagellatus]
MSAPRPRLSCKAVSKRLRPDDPPDRARTSHANRWTVRASGDWSKKTRRKSRSTLIGAKGIAYKKIAYRDVKNRQIWRAFNMKVGEEFQIREDDWSWQLIAPPATKLYVRITSRPSDKTSLIFTDFNIHSAPSDMVQRALDVVRGTFRGPSSGMRLQFLDIFPQRTDFGEDEKKEIILRHDQILNLIKEHGIRQGYTVENSFLDLRGGKYDTIVITG